MNHSALHGFLSADSGKFRKAVTDEQVVEKTAEFEDKVEIADDCEKAEIERAARWFPLAWLDR